MWFCRSNWDELWWIVSIARDVYIYIHTESIPHVWYFMRFSYPWRWQKVSVWQPSWENHLDSHQFVQSSARSLALITISIVAFCVFGLTVSGSMLVWRGVFVLLDWCQKNSSKNVSWRIQWTGFLSLHPWKLTLWSFGSDVFPFQTGDFFKVPAVNFLGCTYIPMIFMIEFEVRLTRPTANLETFGDYIFSRKK